MPVVVEVPSIGCPSPSQAKHGTKPPPTFASPLERAGGEVKVSVAGVSQVLSPVAVLWKYTRPGYSSDGISLHSEWPAGGIAGGATAAP